MAASDAPETIFTLLIAFGFVATGLVWLVGSDEARTELRALALPLASLVAIGAMFGSLYFSEIRNYTPCEFCWYQRIAMYPLAVLLPIAAWRRDRAFVPYALVAASIGAAISVYHYQLQLFPDQGSSCDAFAPCSFKWVEVFGFVSIPLLAFGSFVLIVALLAISIHRPAPVVDEEVS